MSNGLLERESATGNQKDVDPAGLAAALAELGIQPFTSESVDRYKQRAASRINWKAALCQWFLEKAAPCILVAGIIAIVGIIGGLIACGCYFAVPMSLVGIFFAVLGLVSANAGAVGFLRDKRLSFAEWEQGTLAKYHACGGVMPQTAIDMMAKITKEYPKARFWVDELVLNSISLDPFLVVDDADDRYPKYYLCVWSEPKFKGK